MSQRFTKSAARNVFYGGSLFFILLFLVLTFHTNQRLPATDNRAALTGLAAQGKRLWEENNCVGCHTLLGEGAYFAPELGNAWQRLGGAEGIKVFIRTRPKEGVPGRRSMPNFGFTEAELDALAEFLKYSSGINAASWPPNIQG